MRARVWHWHLISGLCRIFLITLSLWAAFQLRFDFSIPAADFRLFTLSLAIALPVKLVVLYGMHLHREPWWRYLGFPDVMPILKSNMLASGAFTLIILAVIGSAYPRSVYCVDLMLCFLLTAGTRFAIRLREEFWRARRQRGARGLLIYGAGVAGIALAREIRNNPKLGYRMIGFLDDDPRKQRATLMGLPVLGSGEQAGRVVTLLSERQTPVAEIVVTMPSATGRKIRAALAQARATGLPCRIVPGLGELISGRLSVGRIREVSVTDLLGREPVKLNLEEVRSSLTGRSVLVTGAAGSIGSELCRQIGEQGPRCLVVLDQAESEMFHLERQLRADFPDVNLQPELADIRDTRRLEDVLDRHAVSVIFHAAAYKHVPIVERQICEGVRNNVLGTWNLVQAACRADVSTFVMISTDKAVNPTSIMGLTKRVAELIVTANRPGSAVPRTRFVCLRFGNVLVSNGSVVPIFQKQIAAGGPVTVTHPEIRRYFMTVQEAVQLVLHASTIGKGGEIFVLDMGKPVRILDLARKMITLAGFTPDEDIEIRFSGLRPGEKLFEELNLDQESILPTSHEKIKIFRGKQLTMQYLASWIAEMQRFVWAQDGQAAIQHMKGLVPEYLGPSQTQQMPSDVAEEPRVTTAALVGGFEVART